MIAGEHAYIYCAECNSTLRAELVRGQRIPIGIDVRVYEEIVQQVREALAKLPAAERAVLGAPQ